MPFCPRNIIDTTYRTINQPDLCLEISYKHNPGANI
jgi:hypothetical protein